MVLTLDIIGILFRFQAQAKWAVFAPIWTILHTWAIFATVNLSMITVDLATNMSGRQILPATGFEVFESSKIDQA